jgi:dihydrofolate reductase
MGKLISILHADNKWGIGKKNDLMFHLKKDMAFFRNTTKGHVVVMGENTLLSFPNSQPLKNRTNIVLSKDKNYEGVINVHNFEDFLKIIKEELKKDDVFVIGGASIYKQTLPYVDLVYLTKVDADGNAEVFFDNLDINPSFELISSTPYEDDNGYQISFTTYKNINKKEL